MGVYERTGGVKMGSVKREVREGVARFGLGGVSRKYEIRRLPKGGGSKHKACNACERGSHHQSSYALGWVGPSLRGSPYAL